eukprot:5683792-Alexandrium_andersonii.AAC.1
MEAKNASSASTGCRAGSRMPSRFPSQNAFHSLRAQAAERCRALTWSTKVRCCFGSPASAGHDGWRAAAEPSQEGAAGRPPPSLGPGSAERT